MITLTTLIIAGILTVALLLLSMALPHPITWIGPLIMCGILFFILLPKYQAQQQAVQQGVMVQAAVQQVREWKQKHNDDVRYRYEILAVAPNPSTGKMQTFISPPLSEDPQPYLEQTVTVKVDWNHPKAYVMDVSFLPFEVY